MRMPTVEMTHTEFGKDFLIALSRQWFKLSKNIHETSTQEDFIISEYFI